VAGPLAATPLKATPLDTPALNAVPRDTSALTATPLDTPAVTGTPADASPLTPARPDATALDAAALDATALDASPVDASSLDGAVPDAKPGLDPGLGAAQAVRTRPRPPLSAGRWHSLPAGLAFTRGASRRATARAARAGGKFSWPWRVAWIDVVWALFSVVNLVAILVFSSWETIPFHFIWISLTLLYGFRVWATRPTLWVLAVVMVTTFAAISWDVSKGAQSVDELNEVPLMAMMFWLMVWHAQRRLDADHERDLVSDENARLLATQRRFLQDASHQLRTPITIALGHAELLARELTDQTEQRDIQVVVGELSRLRRLGERLLVIAASEDPDFLRPEPVALDGFTMDVIRRWRPTADRRWQVGRLDAVTVGADRERLGLAVDALLENAVRHTSSGDMIQLSVLVTGPGLPVRMIVADTGEGIAPSELEHIFDRFRTGSPAGGTTAAGTTGTGSKGTGLGLALVRAVAHAHGGDVRVRSTPGVGSEFELVLPAPAVSAGALYPALPLSWSSSPPEPVPDRTLKDNPWPSRNR
jgi:signal transduction histidine kinase